MSKLCTPVLKKISLENGLIKLYCVLSNMVTLNETHTMILVFAADDFRTYPKMQKLRFLKINHQKSDISKKSSVGVFQVG